MSSLFRTTLLLACALPLAALDLERAIVVTPPDLTGPEKKAVAMLIEEIEKRTQIRLETSTNWPAAGVPTIALLPQHSAAQFAGSRLTENPVAGPAEGYRLRVAGNGVWVTGNDARGLLFGAGRLLRLLQMERQKLAIADNVNLVTAPAIPLRGHQLGYRPKTNSYDGWTVAMWEQYIRDLAVFGTNAIELIPPRSDDDADSPLFPLPPMKMMVEMSRICAEYGIDVWIWYPAMDRDYSDPATVEAALKEWGEVFRQLPRIDAVFVPGGDPGHTQPKYLMALLEKETEVLHKYHPKAQMWVSPQSFNDDWMNEFLSIMRAEPKWLSGVVHGPQVRISIADLRKRIPARYPLRNYPDITHSLKCQFPVPDWDTAYALTEGREPINPRPLDEANIFHYGRAHSIGFLTYSEGCNDDVNKIVWSGLGWAPDARVVDILREYARYFIGIRLEDSFAQGLLALEQNWRGSLLANSGVDTTLEQFRAMERVATPQQKLSWRFQQALYRAYYDAYDRSRLIEETAREEAAMRALRGARVSGSEQAMGEAEHALAPVGPFTGDVNLRARVFELAEALFQSVRMQLSVGRYQAIAVGRGANLDAIDMPLNNRPWLLDQFARIRKLDGESARLSDIDRIVDWTNPGPGGFYDDLGNPANQPHLVRGKGPSMDPQLLESSLVAFSQTIREANGPYRISWQNHAETLLEQPLRMVYRGLDPEAQYLVRVVYVGETSVETRLTANNILVHPFLKRPVPSVPLEFPISRRATRTGELTLEWVRTPGLGGNGRGNQIAEVWLIRK